MINLLVSVLINFLFSQHLIYYFLFWFNENMKIKYQNLFIMYFIYIIITYFTNLY